MVQARALCARLAFVSMSVVSVMHAGQLSVGGKVWFATPEVDLTAVEATFEQGVFVGPTFTYSFAGDLWVSGTVLTGSSEDNGRGSDVTMDQLDVECIVGKSFSFWDAGVGIGVSQFSVTDQWSSSLNAGQDVLSYGAVVFVGAGHVLGNLPLGVYGGISLLPFDMGDGDDEFHQASSGYLFFENGEYINVEGGLYTLLDQWTFRLGYRYRDYFRDDTARRHVGAMATGTWTF